ncbi:hypothetical protein CHH53_10990 [Terribacillus sp. 7520-G]|nr:hypothetical protein CHH53_10990 [Terribacillus sp. 7520-G]
MLISWLGTLTYYLFCWIHMPNNYMFLIEMVWGGWSVTVKVFVHILGTYIDCAAIMNKWGKSIPAGN